MKSFRLTAVRASLPGLPAARRYDGVFFKLTRHPARRAVDKRGPRG